MRAHTRGQALIWLGVGLAVAGVVAAQQWRTRTQRPPWPPRDYSSRSGFPRGVEASRGAAGDAVIPPDMRTPELLRPFETSR